MVGLKETEEIIINKIKGFYSSCDHNKEENENISFFFINQQGFLDEYEGSLKVYPFLRQKPALMIMIKPNKISEICGKVLFNINGKINGINDLISNKFGISKDILSTSDKEGLSVFDIFNGLQDCLKEFKDTPSNSTFLLEFNKNSVLNYIKFKNLSRSTSNQQYKSQFELSGSQMSSDNNRDIKFQNTEMLIHLENPYSDNKNIFLMRCEYAKEKERSYFGFEQPLGIRSDSNPFLTQHFDDSNKQSVLRNHHDLDRDMVNSESEVSEFQHLNPKKKKQEKERIVKNLVSEKKVSTGLLRHYISLVLIFLVCLGVHIGEFVNEESVFSENESLIDYTNTIYKLDMAVWKSLVTVRKLDLAYSAGPAGENAIDNYKRVLVNQIDIIKSNLPNLLNLNELYVLPKKPDYKYLKVLTLISEEEFVVDKSLGDSYLNYSAVLDKIVRSKRNSFKEEEFKDLYFILRNGVNTLLVG